MIKKGLKLAGFIGAAFMMFASIGTEVHAESSEAEYLSTVNPILRIQDWDDRAAATNVKEFASIRKDKSTESARIGVLMKGSYVEVLEFGEEWTKVKSGKIEGYMLTKYLAFADDAKEVYSEVHGVKGSVKNKNAKVMKHPFSKSTVIDKKGKGVEVKVLAKIGNWYRIQLNKTTTAYMHADDVEIKDSVAISIEDYNKMLEEKKAAEEAAKKPASNNNTSSNKGSMSASKSELDMLAAIIQCEAEGESYKGKVAVGAVVLNRVRSNKFPNTIEKVIKEKGQFSPVASGKFARVLSKGANEECYRAAKDALNGSNPIGKCLFFNTGYGKGFRLGGHQFY